MLPFEIPEINWTWLCWTFKCSSDVKSMGILDIFEIFLFDFLFLKDKPIELSWVTANEDVAGISLDNIEYCLFPDTESINVSIEFWNKNDNSMI